MAVIGKIRQRSGLLIFIIGASIVGFLLMDATNSQSGVLRGRNTTVGKVNGHEIDIQEYEKKYEENLKSQEEQMRGQGLNDDMRNYMRTMTWDQMVNEAIFEKVYEKLGITVSPAEMAELLAGSENPHPYIRQNFSNPATGQFDPSQVRLFLQNIDKDDPNTEPGTRRKQWTRLEEAIQKDQYQKKYENLITKGLYVPSWQGEMAYNDQTRTVDFRYVQLPFTDINDADVKVTDDDLKKYIQDHPAKFKREEETRKIQYVTFDIQASSADSAAIIAGLEAKKEEFAKGEKVSDDSVFVKVFSEVPFDGVYYTKDQLNSPVTDTFFSTPVKSIIGPYADENSFKLAKISDRKMISDSVRVRDIAISFAGITTQEQAAVKYALIDSIIRQIDSLKGDFTAFALAFSDDAVSKMKGGDLGWVKQGEKDKYYNDIIFFRAQKGKTYRIPSETDNAWHLVQVVEEKPSKQGVLLTYLSREILPSAETEKTIYGQATGFASDNHSEAKFLAASKKLNVKTVSDLKKDAFNVTGLGSARELVKWAFTAEKGNVSSIFTVNGKHVVAMLESISPKGLAPVDDVRDFVKSLVVREKKSKMLAEKIEAAKSGNIDELASKLGKPAMQVDKASFNNPNMNGFYEPKVVAAALNTSAGKVSKPIDASTGVFVVQTIAVQEAPKATDYSVYTMQLKQQITGKARMAPEVQKKLAKIDDNRSEFF